MWQQSYNQPSIAQRNEHLQPLETVMSTQSPYPVFNPNANKQFLKPAKDQSVSEINQEKNLNWPVFEVKTTSQPVQFNSTAMKGPAERDSTWSNNGSVWKSFGANEEHQIYYQGVGERTSAPRVDQPSPSATGMDPPQVLKTYYPINYQTSPNDDPRNRFYNSSTEYGLHQKPPKEFYTLAQSLGQTTAVRPNFGYAAARQPTMPSTNEGSWSNGKQQESSLKYQQFLPYQQPIWNRQNYARPMSSNSQPIFQKKYSLEQKERPQTPTATSYSQPWNYPHSSPQISAATVSYQHPSTVPDYNHPPSLPQNPPYLNSQYGSRSPSGQVTSLVAPLYAQPTYVPTIGEYQSSPSSEYLLSPSFTKQPSMLRPYAQKYSYQQSRIDNPNAQSIIERLNGESIISAGESCLENLPVLQKIVEYIEILDEFMQNIGQFDKQCTAIQGNRSQGLVNFYLFKRCFAEKVRLERCLRGGSNLFDQVDFLEVTDQELDAFRNDPDNRDVFQMVTDENTKLANYLRELLEAFKNKFKIFPKANTNLQENFEYELCYYMHKEVEAIEETLMDPDIVAKERHQLRRRQAFLYEALFLLEFFNGRFLKYYEDYKQLPDLRKYLKGHKKAYAKIIMKYLQKK